VHISALVHIYTLFDLVVQTMQTGNQGYEKREEFFCLKVVSYNYLNEIQLLKPHMTQSVKVYDFNQEE